MPIGLFLDRDGTINEEVEFLSSPRDVRLIPGAARVIREANVLGFKVIVITNQSGIARGLFTEQDFHAVNDELFRLLRLEGAAVDALYYCPHHPDGEPPYRLDCECRKPRTGMLRRAADELGIDLSRSFVIGDRLSDLQAGIAAGASSILVLTGYGAAQRSSIDPQSIKITYIAKDIADAFEEIKRLLGNPQRRISSDQSNSSFS